MVTSLVVIKASYVQISTFWDWAMPTDYLSWLYLSWAATASQSDLLFGIGIALIGGLASCFTVSYPRLHRSLFVVFIGWAVLCVLYAIVGRQIFGYFGSQLTLPFITMGGDFSKMRDSILPYVTVPALYDFKADPFERHNIVFEHPEDAKRLHQRLAAMFQFNKQFYGAMWQP